MADYCIQLKAASDVALQYKIIEAQEKAQNQKVQESLAEQTNQKENS